MKDIVSVIELSNHNAAEEVNSYLASGWQLLHVGPMSGDITNDQQVYWTTYVIGATQDVYDAYLDEKKNNSNDQIVRELFNI